ncbi:MAG: septum formation protein Maf [Bacteroidales bacterium]|nr:septum formation protein Maf [Bacteroidota bacterium]MBR6064046.1 septum formation protein Maf [Bacteroidales bacterium]
MLLDILKDYKVYLCSKSPRRHELLAGMGIDFEYLPTNVVEKHPDTDNPVEVAEYLSQLKLSPVKMEDYPKNTIFIACDTIVVLGNEILEKPKDEADAMTMIRELSGKSHTVISGLTVATPERSITSHRKTEVRFSQLSDEEIRYYVQQYKPYDKAGAYGVQEWIGYIGIEAINGSFYNVMGLPTKLLWEMLKEVSGVTGN